MNENKLTKVLRRIDSEIESCKHEIESETELKLLGKVTDRNGQRDIYQEPVAENIIELHSQLINLMAEKSKLELRLLDPIEFLKDFTEQKLCEKRLRNSGYKLITSTGIGHTFQSVWSRNTQRVILSSLDETSAYVHGVVEKARPIAQITYHSTHETQTFYTGEESVAVAAYIDSIDTVGPDGASYEVIPGPGDDLLKYRFQKALDNEFGVRTLDINEFRKKENEHRNAGYQSAISAGIPEKYARAILVNHAVFDSECKAITFLPEPSDQVFTYLHDIRAFGVSIRTNPITSSFDTPVYSEPQFFVDAEEALRVINADREQRGQDPVENDFVETHTRPLVDCISIAQAKSKDRLHCSTPKQAKSREEER